MILLMISTSHSVTPCLLLLPSAPASSRLESFLGHLNRVKHCPRLIHSFCVLMCGNRVGNDSRPCLHSYLTIAEDNGSNGNTGIKVIGIVHVQHRTSVDPASIRFQLADNLHGPNLWRSRNGSCWKARSKCVEAI